MLRKALLLLLASFTIVMGVDRSADAQEKVARLTREILPSALAEEGRTAQIKAFDLAPDGSSVAVLYASWRSSPDPTPAELWVAVWNISDNKPVWKQRIETDTTSGAARVHDVKDLIFTADQSHLLALAVKRIWSVDAGNGGTTVTIAARAGLSGTPVQVSAVTGAKAAITYRQNEDSGFYTQLIDVSSGNKINGWATTAIPQSFSADGKLAITVIPGNGTLEVQVVDTSNGATLRTIPVEVSSEKGHSRESVSAAARFLDNTMVVIVPNQKINHSGRPAAYGLQLIDALDGKLVREINPQYFRPTGELAVSRDGNRFAVESIYARERDVLLDSLHPKDLRVNLFIFQKDSAMPETAIPNVYAGLAGGKGEPVRFSSHGTVLGVSESPSGSIKIFQIKAP